MEEATHDEKLFADDDRDDGADANEDTERQQFMKKITVGGLLISTVITAAQHQHLQNKETLRADNIDNDETDACGWKQLHDGGSNSRRR